MVRAVFQIEVETVGDFITLDGIEGKITRMAGGVGLKALSVKQIDSDQAESIEARLIDWIGQQGGSASIRDVQRAFGFKSADSAEDAMKAIVNSGYCRWVNIQTKNPGRPARGVELVMSESQQN